MKIYLKNNPKFKSVRELLIWYFKNGSPETYYESNMPQCEAGRKRSFEDLLDLTNTYFEVTPKELIKTLNDIYLTEDFNGSKLINLFCPTIQKNIFYLERYPTKGTLDNTILFNGPEFNDKLGNGNFTRMELLKLIKEE